MFVVAVTFRIKPESADSFLSLILENARSSVADEPGCQRFDVARSPGDRTELFLYELYDDEAAFQAHLQTAHFKAFDTASGDMVASKDVKTYSLVTDAEDA